MVALFPEPGKDGKDGTATLARGRSCKGCAGPHTMEEVNVCQSCATSPGQRGSPQAELKEALTELRQALDRLQRVLEAYEPADR